MASQAQMTWDILVENALPKTVPTQDTQCIGCVDDKTLKSMIKAHIGAKSCPTTIKREELLKTAVNLGLLSDEQASVSRTKKSRNKSLKKTVKDDSPRASQLIDTCEWVPNKELQILHHQHIDEECIPQSLGRKELLNPVVVSWA